MAQLDQQTAELVRKLVEEQLRMKNEELNYRLDNMSMKRYWEYGYPDNLDATHPITYGVYVPPRTKLVSLARINLRLQNFRSYSEVTDQFRFGAAIQTGEAVWNISSLDTASAMSSYSHWHTTNYVLDHSHTVTSSGGLHDHGDTGPGSTDLHVHETFNAGSSHSHTNTVTSSGGHDHETNTDYHDHTLYKHIHYSDLPEHQHQQKHGIYESTAASNVGIIINGVDRTVALGGPFTTSTYGIDVAQYLTTGDNTIQFTSATLGRLYATMSIELYLP